MGITKLHFLVKASKRGILVYCVKLTTYLVFKVGNITSAWVWYQKAPGIVASLGLGLGSGLWALGPRLWSLGSGPVGGGAFVAVEGYVAGSLGSGLSAFGRKQGHSLCRTFTVLL